jgi:transposase
VGNRIAVPFELEDFELGPAEVVDGWLEVPVSSTFPRACHHCGSLAVTGHGRIQRRIRDCSFGRPTVLLWNQRRFRCLDCSRTCRERHPALPAGRAVTKRFRRQLFERACLQPFSHVAENERVSWYRVLDAFETYAELELEIPIAAPRVLALDESAFKRRMCFHTVMSDPEQGLVIAMTEGRDKTAAINALLQLEPSVRAAVETVVIDCHWPFRQAVEFVLPEARIVADKFHVLRSVDQAAQKVRVRAGRLPKEAWSGPKGPLARQNHPRCSADVFRLRWVFMKREEKLSSEELAWLESVFDHSFELRMAWLIKEQFARIYFSTNRKDAETRLQIWVDNINQYKLKEFQAVWRVLELWKEPILAYFDDRVTNGFAEGITNKIKVMKRVSYGFRNSYNYRRKVLLMSARRRSRGSAHRIS